MKITHGFLVDLGFVQQKNNNDILVDKWQFLFRNRLYRIMGGPDHWKFYPPSAMEFDYTVICTVQEMFHFIFEDCIKTGKETLTNDFRKLLRIT